jgi:hypothetical protein
MPASACADRGERPTACRNKVPGRSLDRNPVNVTGTDLVGRADPVYFAGARLPEVFPVRPLMDTVSLGVGALSYAGQFNMAVIASRPVFRRCQPRPRKGSEVVRTGPDASTPLWTLLPIRRDAPTHDNG